VRVTRASALDAADARLRALRAGDEARHRVERDLHDGVQQRLLALTMRLGLPNAREDPQLLPQSVEQLRLALAELRQLVRGSNPTVLKDYGLDGALQSLADHAQLPVGVMVEGLRPLPEEIERTVYFVASEGLTNAIKHAGASKVEIAVAVNGKRLTMKVSDDGGGGANPDGSGLRGLAERAAAVGGTLRVESPQGGGTVLLLTLTV